ncbi:MAG: hypothetical protein KGH63_01035 [Candidatus Micrarchaeota archaeon]|nr:hypothetical protein [Candidatus Micrarchaeota archaeon]
MFFVFQTGPNPLKQVPVGSAAQLPFQEAVKYYTAVVRDGKNPQTGEQVAMEDRISAAIAYSTLLAGSKNAAAVQQGVADIKSLALSEKSVDGRPALSADGKPILVLNSDLDQYQVGRVLTAAYAATRSNPDARLDELESTRGLEFKDWSEQPWAKTFVQYGEQAVGCYAVSEFAAATQVATGTAPSPDFRAGPVASAAPLMTRTQAQAIVDEQAKMLGLMTRALGDGGHLMENATGDPTLGQAVEAQIVLLNSKARDVRALSALSLSDLDYTTNRVAEQLAFDSLGSALDIEKDAVVKAMMGYGRAFGRSFSDMDGGMSGENTVRAQGYSTDNFTNVAYGLLQSTGAYNNPAEFPAPWPADQGGFYGPSVPMDDQTAMYFTKQLQNYLMNARRDDVSKIIAGLKIPVLKKDDNGQTVFDAKGVPVIEQVDTSPLGWAYYTLSRLADLSERHPELNQVLVGAGLEMKKTLPVPDALVGANPAPAAASGGTDISARYQNPEPVPRPRIETGNPGFEPVVPIAPNIFYVNSQGQTLPQGFTVDLLAEWVRQAWGQQKTLANAGQPIDFQNGYVKSADGTTHNYPTIGGYGSYLFSFAPSPDPQNFPYWQKLPGDGPTPAGMSDDDYSSQLAQADLKSGNFVDLFKRMTKWNEQRGLLNTPDTGTLLSKNVIPMWRSVTLQWNNADTITAASFAHNRRGAAFIPGFFSAEVGLDQVNSVMATQKYDPISGEPLEEPQVSAGQPKYTLDVMAQQGFVLLMPTKFLEQAAAAVTRSAYNKLKVEEAEKNEGKPGYKPVIVNDFAYKFADYLSMYNLQTQESFGVSPYGDEGFGIRELTMRFNPTNLNMVQGGAAKKVVAPYVATTWSRDSFSSSFIDPNTGRFTPPKAAWTPPQWEVGLQADVPVSFGVMEVTLRRLTGGNSNLPPQHLVQVMMAPEALLNKWVPGLHTQLSASFNTQTFFSAPGQRPFDLNWWTAYDFRQSSEMYPNIRPFVNFHLIQDIRNTGQGTAVKFNIGVQVDTHMGGIY